MSTAPNLDGAVANFTQHGPATSDGTETYAKPKPQTVSGF